MGASFINAALATTALVTLPNLAVVSRTSNDGSDSSHTVTWQAEITDRGNWWASGTNLTQPSGGTGLVRATYCQACGGARDDDAYTQKGGSNLVVGMARQGSGFTHGWLAGTSAIVSSATGNTFSLGVNNGVNSNSWMQVEEIPSATKYAVVYRSSAQATVAGTYTDITFDLELADVGGWHAGSAAGLIVPAGQGITLVRLTANCVSYYASGSNVQDRYHFLRVLRQSGSQVGMPYQSCMKQVNYSSNNVVSAIVAVADLDEFRASVLVSNVANNIGASAGAGAANVGHYTTWFQIEQVDSATKYCLLKKAATQVLSAGVDTALVFAASSEVVDTEGAHDTSTNNTRITVPPGCTEARVTYNFIGANVNGAVRAYIKKNGAGWSAPQPVQQQDVTGQPEYLNAMSAWAPVVPGDYFEMIVWSSTGQTVPVSDHTWFQVEFR